MVIGGTALALLGVRRYVFKRPPLLGPSGRLVATGATVFMGYPFLRGALRSLRSGRAGTDALVTRGDGGQPGAARERRRTHRAVAAQHR